MKKIYPLSIFLFIMSFTRAQNHTLLFPDCMPVPATCYPLPLNAGTLGIGISSVNINQIMNATVHTTSSFENYTCTDSTYLDIGTPYTFQVTTGQTYEESVTAWIDFNNDGDFNASEIVFHDSAVVYTHFGTIQVPLGSPNQNQPIRMRIGSVAGAIVLTGCNQPDYGEYEDYKIYYGPSTFISSFASDVNVSISPNPFLVSTTVITKGMKPESHLQFDLYNPLGKKIKCIELLNEAEFILERDDLPAGIYFYSITGERNIFSGKLLIADEK